MPNTGWSALEELRDDAGHGRNAWQASICARCNAPSIWRDDQLVYPLGGISANPHPDMPSEVRELYEEAAIVAAVSPRAGAALARATVERLVKLVDTGAKATDTLNTRVERLQQRVSSNLRTMLHVVRVTGNDVLHQEQPGVLAVMALDDTEGPQLLEHLLRTANDLVDELISRQHTVNDLHGKLPEWVQKKLASGPSSTS